MRIDLLQPDSWARLCDQYRGLLPFESDGIGVQVYAGYHHALLESSRELARLFTHKKTIAIVSEMEAAFDPVSVYFSQEGYTIKPLTVGELQNSSEWLESVKDDLLFIMYSIDDPVTERLYELGAFEAAFASLRVFRIGVSHQAHRYQPWVRPGGFEARVLSLSPERSLLIAGERFRVSPVLTPHLPWKAVDVQYLRDDLTSHTADEVLRFRDEIELFEASLPDGFQRHFNKGEPRVPDRSVFYHLEVDGWSFVTALASELGTSVNEIGCDGLFESTTLCRWPSLRQGDWLRSRGFSIDQIRGMVVLSRQVLNRCPASLLAGVAQAVEKRQNGV